MSDTTYNKFQHYGTNAERLAFVPSPPAATQPIYIWYETDTGKTFLYHTAWVQISAGAGLPLHHTTHELGGTDEVTLAQSQITGLVTDLAGKAAATHAPTHAAAGSDPLSILTLTGYPGGTTNFLREDGTFAAVPLPVRIGSITMVIDGGASVIATGLKGYLEIPFACTIQAVTLLADIVGSIVVDIWKDTYANYPPTVADTIVAAAKPTITTAIKSQDTTLTGWNTAIVAGDVLGFNVDSVALIKKVTLSLKIQAA